MAIVKGRTKRQFSKTKARKRTQIRGTRWRKSTGQKRTAKRFSKRAKVRQSRR